MMEPTDRPADKRPAAETRSPAPGTNRTRIRRHADRAVPEQIEEFLRDGLVAHVALVVDGEPRLIPFLYQYEAGTIYIHGSPANATMRLARDGRTVAVAVTAVDELVASKSADMHTVNYRSVVAYGRGRRITDTAEKRRLLDAMTARYFSGRSAPRDYEPATDDTLDKMELTAIDVDEASAKAREGGPKGPHDDDAAFPGSAWVRSIRPGIGSEDDEPV